MQQRPASSSSRSSTTAASSARRGAARHGGRPRARARGRGRERSGLGVCGGLEVESVSRSARAPGAALAAIYPASLHDTEASTERSEDAAGVLVLAVDVAVALAQRRGINEPRRHRPRASCPGCLFAAATSCVTPCAGSARVCGHGRAGETLHVVALSISLDRSVRGAGEHPTARLRRNERSASRPGGATKKRY